ncbi:MAG: YihY/virulence factor BrkB family protein [Oscillospiraceae bacterium]|nr:YihY/virulence factor BrkB family protein [Oscillospiraceae bacterium]
MKWVRFAIGKGRQIAAFLRPMAISLHGAYTAFFLILSLFPSLLLLLALLGRTEWGVEALLDVLQGLLPQALIPVAEALVGASRRGSGAVLSLSALAALWSASRGMYGLLGGLKAVYGVKNAGGYWRRRFVSVAYTLTFLLVLVATLLLHVFGTAILDYLLMTTNPLLMTISRAVDLQFLLLLILQSILFAVMYALLPGRRGRLRACVPGAIGASLGWLIFSELFSVYMTHFAGYTDIFGSVYALALGMLWLYFCICILLWGAALNRWLEEN